MPPTSARSITARRRTVQQILQKYKNCRTSSPFSGSRSFPTRTRSPWPGPADAAVPLQPFTVAETFTGKAGNMSASQIRSAASRRSLRQARRHPRTGLLHEGRHRRGRGGRKRNGIRIIPEGRYGWTYKAGNRHTGEDRRQRDAQIVMAPGVRASSACSSGIPLSDALKAGAVRYIRCPRR